MKKKTVLITGGAGFIGSHLCERLINDDYKVVCIDNLITGNLDNLKGLSKDKNFRFERHDVSKFISIKEKIDFVLHFASPASPVDYLNFPIQTLKVGSLGTHNALGLAKLNKSRFLLASTSEVYGDPLVHPQKETYWGNVNCVGPRGVYDESKRFAESITMAYHKMHRLDIKIARIFNTYGPRMRINDGRAIPNFINQALNNKPLTVYGKGSQTRSFCYVDDLVEGLFRLMHAKTRGPINLGNPNEMALLDLAKLIIRISNSKSRLVFKPLPVDDPRQRRPDIGLAVRYLKWKPHISLGMGLEKTLLWFKQNS